MTEEFSESMINDIREGGKITDEVQQVEDRQVVMHINGGKFNGIIPISRLSTHHTESPSEVVKVGNEIEAYITKIEFDEENDTGAYILLRRRLETEEPYEYLREKLDNDEVIEAEVIEVVKGGLVVDVGQGGFAPASPISTDFIEDLSVSDGQIIRIKVRELSPESNRVILNRKAVKQLENDAKKVSILDSLNESDVIDGRAARLTNFGAFVNIGGVDDLVHVSELFHEHVQTPEEAMSTSEAIKVEVKSVEKDSERVSLSIKDTLPTPFKNIKGRFHEDDIIESTVVRLASFGTFVEIAPSVQGLVHISETDHKHIGPPNEALKPGQQVNIKVLGIDEDNERISLSIKTALPKENVIESNVSTTQSYPKDDNDEDKSTLGGVFGDKFKDLGS